MWQTPDLIYWKYGKFGSSSFTMNEANYSTVKTQKICGRIVYIVHIFCPYEIKLDEWISYSETIYISYALH